VRKHVDSLVGYRHFEQLAAQQSVADKDIKPFAKECPFQLFGSAGDGYTLVIGTAVDYQHAGIHTGGTECTHEPERYDGGSAFRVGSVEYYDFHFFWLLDSLSNERCPL
jgi:hypothetical protein